VKTFISQVKPGRKVAFTKILVFSSKELDIERRYEVMQYIENFIRSSRAINAVLLVLEGQEAAVYAAMYANQAGIPCIELKLPPSKILPAAQARRIGAIMAVRMADIGIGFSGNGKTPDLQAMLEQFRTEHKHAEFWEFDKPTGFKEKLRGIYQGE